MKPRTYSCEGRGHRLLRILSNGPHSFADICQAEALTPGKLRTKAFMALVALRDDAFVSRDGPETYVITSAGSDLLARLDAGEPVQVEPTRPNVRIFAGQGSGSGITRPEVAA